MSRVSLKSDAIRRSRHLHCFLIDQGQCQWFAFEQIVQEGDCVLDCLLLLFSSSALFSVLSLLELRFFLRLLILLLSDSCTDFLFRFYYRSCCSFRLCALLKESKRFRGFFVSSRSLSPSFVSLLNFSHIDPHHPSCFALVHRCWNVTVTLSRFFVFFFCHRANPGEFLVHNHPVEISFLREAFVVQFDSFLESFLTLLCRLNWALGRSQLGIPASCRTLNHSSWSFCRGAFACNPIRLRKSLVACPCRSLSISLFLLGP